jgi:hypothetical protein
MSVTMQQPQFIEGGFIWVNCQVTEGALGHEYGVLVQGADGQHESMVDTDIVSVEEVPKGDVVTKGKLPAKVIKINGVNLLVELPRQVVAGGRRVWIPKTEAHPNGASISSGHSKAH